MSRKIGLGKIVLAGLTVLVGAGIIVFSFQLSGSSTNSATRIKDQNSKISLETLPANKIREEAEQLLVIKEWGIELPLSENISDAYYTPQYSGSKTPTVMWFGTKSLDEKGTCKASLANKGKKGLSAIMRVGINETDPVIGELYTKLYPVGTTIDEYYYAFLNNYIHNPCSTDTNVKDKLEKTTKALGGAVEQASKR